VPPLEAPSLVSSRPRPAQLLNEPSAPIALSTMFVGKDQSPGGHCFMRLPRPTFALQAANPLLLSLKPSSGRRYACITLAGITRDGCLSCNTGASHDMTCTNPFRSHLPLYFPFRVKWARSNTLFVDCHCLGLLFSMASLVNLSAECMDNLKSILTSQDFGSEYEMLCTELSVQWLRIRLWGQTVSRIRHRLA
jgi:hypothetical protein